MSGFAILRELSISLWGRWEPDRLFMIFTAHLDESDTHGPAPDMVMSGLLGSGRQWELFGRGLRGLQRDYGFSILHATEFHGRQGEFSDWPYEKFRDFYRDLSKEVDGTLAQAISVTLKHAVYKEHYATVRPKKMRPMSQYGLLFLATLHGLTKAVMDMGPKHKLSVVVESGHKNAAETAEIFKNRQEAFLADGRDFLKSHTLLPKKESPFLMVADFTAFATAMQERAIKSGDMPPLYGRPQEPLRRGETGWLTMNVTPGYCATLIEIFNEIKAEKHADWLKRHEAWLASQKQEKPPS